MRTEAGLADVRLHDLRHSFASFLVNSGCTLYEVQKILGHHDPKMTMRYAHLSQDSLIRAANAVGRKFEDAGSSLQKEQEKFFAGPNGPAIPAGLSAAKDRHSAGLSAARKKAK